jgi:adenosine deaminase
VVELVREKGVTLEMCPTSNRQTHAVEDMSRYPLRDFLAKGVRVTLNTDDMGIEGTTLAEEFGYMERDFGLTAEEERTLLRNSVDAAFTSQEVKAQLREQLGL